MENGREERARLLLYNRFQELLTDLTDIDVDSLTERNYITCSSGCRDTSSSIFSLVNSCNEMTDRLIIVFASLIKETDLLIYDAKDVYLNSLLLYGEDAEGILDNEGGDVKMMSNFLSKLHDVSMFITRCYEVIGNILKQLHAFFNLSEQSLNKASERLMTRVWKALGDLLVIIIQIDEIIGKNLLLKEHWNVYAKTMKMVQHNPAQFNAIDDRFKSLCSIITNLDTKLMTGFIFQNCCEQLFSNELKTDILFLKRFQKILWDMLIKWDKESNDELPNRNKLVGIIGMTILFVKVNSSLIDKKFIKNLCLSYKKLPTFHFIGDIMFTPIEFLIKHYPEVEKMAERRLVYNINQAKTTFLDLLCDSLNKDLLSFTEAVNEWKNEIRSIKTSHDFQNSTHQFLSAQCILVLKGAKIAEKISRLVKSVLSGYLNSEKILLKSNVQLLFKLVELIKIISFTAKFYWPTILEWCCHANQYWSGCILRILNGIKNQSGSETSAKNLDWISTLLIAENATSTSVNKSRIIICSMALEIGNYTKVIKGNDYIELDDLLSRIEAIESIGTIFDKVTDCSFLYWHKSLFEIYFENIFDNHQYFVEQFILFADFIQDCTNYIKNVNHCSSEKLIENFQEEIYSLINKHILEKICTRIENDLRLCIHSKHNQTIDEIESKLFPVEKKTKINHEQFNQTDVLHCLHWLKLKPLKIGKLVIDVKKNVELYLEKTFYNLTAVALHDGEIYAKMRHLADYKYNLKFAENKLPYMTVDQGLDILMIMKNLHVFVSNYCYDLNEQMFIEKAGKNRNLNIMYVQQIVNSIKTHGVGIINSAINYAYQFLKKKFYIFSQFLFDDQIKCQLIKEIRYYRDNIEELNQMYPIKRAERVNSTIMKLGVSSDGKTFIDKFRELITQIGNTIGLIRMIRSGAIESSAYASYFIPILNVAQCENNLDVTGNAKHERIVSEVCSKLQSSELTMKVAESVDELIDGFKSTFTVENDYIEMLIAIFAKEFRNYEKFSHLRNFFIIIPSLTLNYIEYISTCRSKLGRKAQSDNDFTFVDDGFCLGIAYILTLLNQMYFYDSLNWFDSVFDKLDTEITRYDEEQKAAIKRNDESYSQTLLIKIQRLKELEKEFEFLMYTMHSATMLFKNKDQEDFEDEMYLEEI